MSRQTARLFVCALLGLLLASCDPETFRKFLTPPTYPYKDPGQVKREAQQVSDRLEAYIREWLEGRASPRIPPEVLPAGINPDESRDFILQRYEEIRPEAQWFFREAQTINADKVLGGVPDPHVTYLKLGTSLAPFGSKLIIEGDFPYSRFFNIQISPPLDGKVYYYNRNLGAAEVAIVDADIMPLPGNTNPFLPGADRTAPNRKYQVSFDLAIGDPVTLNPSNVFPYRGPGNRRVGGLIVAQGPWGEKYGKGPWNQGEIWVRYYAPDRNKGPQAGVPLPRAYYQLPTGERYYITSDFSRFEAKVNSRLQPTPTPPAEPRAYFGPGVGWFKSFGILSSLGEGSMQALGNIDERAKRYIRDLDLGVTGRGEGQPPPGNYEPHATTCNYNTYLGRTMALGPGKVVVLSGKLPVFPNTRDGAQRMERGELRYWSISGYDINPSSKTVGAVIHSIMDDEVVLDAQRRYIIVYSRREDRPANARPENGVTWVEWGPISQLALMIRWMSVAPDWIMPVNPHERNLPWARAAWSGSRYDPELLGRNTHDGFLGAYQPVIHYMRRQDFEAQGAPVRPDQLPPWVLLQGNGPLPRPSLPAPAVRERAAAQSGPATGTGLRYQYFELDSVSSLRDVRGVPKSVGELPALSLVPQQRNYNYGLVFDGLLDVPRDGDYTFYLSSDDGSLLLLDDQPVIDNDGIHAVKTEEGRRRLTRGLHPFRLVYFQWFADQSLSLEWSGPGISRQAVPPTAFRQSPSP